MWKIKYTLFLHVGLLALANLYCEETLKIRCENLIKHNISVENSAVILEAALKYNAKVMCYLAFELQSP